MVMAASLKNGRNVVVTAGVAALLVLLEAAAKL
jgi:hypothetical protein